MAIPLIDKCKVDRQLSQITTDNHLNLHIKYTQLIRDHQNQLTLLNQANDRTQAQIERLAALCQAVQQEANNAANASNNTSSNPFLDFLGPSNAPLSPAPRLDIDREVFFPSLDRFRDMADAGFETDNNPNIREMQANLERFIRCSTFNFSVAKAKIGAKETLEQEAFNEKKRRERMGDDYDGPDEEVGETKTDVEMTKTNVVDSRSVTIDVIPVATMTPFDEVRLQLLLLRTMWLRGYLRVYYTLCIYVLCSHSRLYLSADLLSPPLTHVCSNHKFISISYSRFRDSLSNNNNNNNSNNNSSNNNSSNNNSSSNNSQWLRQREVSFL